MKKKPPLGKQYIIRFSVITLMVLITGITAGLFAKDGKISLAVLPFENLNRDPQQEYLSGIISSLVRQDLSLSGMVFIVDRENMEEVLNEQKLQFTGVMDDKSIIETGRMVGAEYILKGGYVFLGDDLFLNFDLINTETGRSFSFSERGFQENTVHALSEKLVGHLTGQNISFQSDAGNKTIIASSQQEPGRVMLFSHIVDARVFVDGAFTSYTLGDRTKALELIMPPGHHTIRTHLSANFGVIQLPEILFGDWISEFDLKSGETLILEDKTNHFNSLIYNMQQIVRERIDLIPGSGETARAEHVTSFTDREGVVIPVKLTLSFIETEGEESKGLALIHLEYNGETQDLSYSCLPGKSEEFVVKLYKSDLNVEMDCSSDYRWELNYSIWR
ncbi:CsgG/HfaB family protein, partial [Oceanispirochaeta sp.]|uniref:CsgG/HfaB family protein n=1 Tax=Oceanispirochaeta sp. TaxID=2035350 RepID=UPI0026045696